MSTQQQELPGGVRDATRDRPRSAAQVDHASGGPTARAYYQDAIRLPGYGQPDGHPDQPNRCIPRKPVGFCDHAGHLALASKSPCETRRCPEHWSLWQKQIAVNIVARLAAKRHVAEGALKRILHTVDSWDPERRWTAEAFWQERSNYDVLKAVGGRGGVSIPHPYRTSDRGDFLFETAVEKGEWEEEWGKWSFLRSIADDWDEMKKYIEAGPHAHSLLLCEDLDPDAIPERRTVKNIRSLGRFHIRDMTGYREMARTVMYLLSHAAFEPKVSARGREVSGREEPRQASPSTVTYFGEAHPNSFNPEEELTAAEWDRIQEMAERAVTTTPMEDLEQGGLGDEPDRADCHEDDCEGEIVPLDQLRDYLNRDDFSSRISRRQRRILNGVLFWLDHQGDRPPPSGDEDRVREWLWSWGRQRERTEQVGLGAVGVSL